MNAWAPLRAALALRRRAPRTPWAPGRVRNGRAPGGRRSRARPGCGVRAAPRQRGTRARDAGRGGRHSRSTASRPRRFIRPARRDVGVQPGVDRLSGREDLLRGVRAAAGGAQEPREGRTGRAGAARPPLRRGAACEGARVGRRRGGT